MNSCPAADTIQPALDDFSFYISFFQDSSATASPLPSPHPLRPRRRPPTCPRAAGDAIPAQPPLETRGGGSGGRSPIC
ncbi:hypothetical protein C4D60_Mb01t00090 [Musa balbisiana]|uniref:Uncharacterized protein n=1 Tax=Musa balbisiana TaxID=52838 RepID=A0A4S8JIR2_MUSBA|nr:hypothetical protein C4D60_Mb01t00090 [Musa balbisiana]